MESLELKDISLAAKIFSKAMVNDPLHVFFFPNPKTRERKIFSLYYFSMKINHLNVQRTTDNFEGVILLEKPFEHIFKISLKEFIFGSFLFFKVGPRSLLRMMKYQEWSSKLKKESIADPYWYLGVVVVDPDCQGKGFASKLIKPMLAKADEQNHKVYLETQNPNNIPIYEKYGFVTVSEHKIPGSDVFHYIMVRN